MSAESSVDLLERAHAETAPRSTHPWLVIFRGSADRLAAAFHGGRATGPTPRTWSECGGDVNILIGQAYDRVRDDPGYKELVRRTGLPRPK